MLFIRNQKSRSHFSPYTQVLSSMAISCGSLNVGGWMAFSAVAIPKMIAETQAAINATNTTDTTSATTYTLEGDLSTGLD